MKNLGRAAAAAVGLSAALAGCDAPIAVVDAPAEVLKGEWTACLDDGAGDQSRTMIFYPDSFATTTRTYATTGGACGGAETGAAREIWRYRLEGEVPARLGATGADVVAKQLNVANSYETLFTIVYVDETVTPALLYFGDLASDPLQDGTAPEKRPEVLSQSPTFTSR